MGFAKRDFTSLILKTILSTRWIRTCSKLTNVVKLSTPLSATPFEQSLRLTEFLWPYARTLAQLMEVELFNAYLIQLTLSKTRGKETILSLSSLASAAQVIRALASSPTMQTFFEHGFDSYKRLISFQDEGGEIANCKTYIKT